MKLIHKQQLFTAALFCTMAFTTAFAQPADPLPSSTAGKTKQSIVTFVSKVTEKRSLDFVPPAERIATFDNDGTLWAEQPLYFQFLFAIDRVKAQASEHPEWNEKEPYKSLLAGDMKGALARGERSLMEIMAVAHSNMTTEEFESIVKNWLATAKHPTTGQPYTQMAYQPMIELLAYLRANVFKTFIVSGGGINHARLC